jgi:hypothetical protein
MGELINAYKILAGKPEGKRPLGKPTCRRKENIKMNLRETGLKIVGLTGSGQKSVRNLVKTAINFRIDKRRANSRLAECTIGSSRRFLLRAQIIVSNLHVYNAESRCAGVQFMLMFAPSRFTHLIFVSS